MEMSHQFLRDNGQAHLMGDLNDDFQLNILDVYNLWVYPWLL